MNVNKPVGESVFHRIFTHVDVHVAGMSQPVTYLARRCMLPFGGEGWPGHRGGDFDGMKKQRSSRALTAVCTRPPDRHEAVAEYQQLFASSCPRVFN